MLMAAWEAKKAEAAMMKATLKEEAAAVTAGIFSAPQPVDTH
ncbi:hypothetical protein ACP70R_008499 [Stipagrostis hirtigluma subsp. patula]